MTLHYLEQETILIKCQIFLKKIKKKAMVYRIKTDDLKVTLCLRFFKIIFYLSEVQA